MNIYKVTVNGHRFFYVRARSPIAADDRARHAYKAITGEEVRFIAMEKVEDVPADETVVS